jgi:F0F1-type ATP synthase assembly protein I
MSPKWQIRWIEIFLLGGILLIIASFVLRIVYGQQMREAEEHLVARLGISEGVYFISKMVLAVFAIIYFGIRYGKSKKDS